METERVQANWLLPHPYQNVGSSNILWSCLMGKVNDAWAIELSFPYKIR